MSLDEREGLMGFDFELEIKDFGPIEQGKIKTKPFTIFIGPNGSGKSYMAMLLQSMFDSHARSDQNQPIIFNYLSENMAKKEIIEKFVDKLSDFVNQMDEFKKDKSIPTESFDPFIDNIMKLVYESRLSQELSYAFSSPLDDLIQIDKESFQIKINTGSYSACVINEKGNKISLKEHTPIIAGSYERKYIIDFLNRQNYESLSEFPAPVRAIFELTISSMIMFFIRAIEFLKTSCYYLPAARSGIILVRKKILTDEYKKNPYPNSKPIQDQQLSGAVSSFIYNIHHLPEEQGPFYDLARDLEKEMIKGEITRSHPEGHIYPDFKYKYLDKYIPLHVTSSTVSELTPIILYLKYVIKSGDVLIIEEPEAHLHPTNQLILAKYLVRLVRNGVQLVITTHSDYLLQKLSNFVIAGQIEPKCADYLLPNEVGAYVFVKGGANVYKIDEMEVTSEDGISESDFSKVVDLLYDETIALKENLQSKGS